MKYPQHYNLLNRKYDNFVEYCNAAGFYHPENVADDIIEHETEDINYYTDKRLAYARIAWSIIKAGIYYEKGAFNYVLGNTTLRADLPMMLELIFGHLVD